MENDKIMTQTLDNQDRYTRITECGQWRMKSNQIIVWEVTKETRRYDPILKDWYIKETKVSELTPEQSPFKLCKNMDVDVLLLREKVSEDDFNKVILCYDRKIAVSVKPDNPHIYLTLGDDFRVYVKDLLNQCTYRYDLGLDSLVYAKKISEKKIVKETAITLKTGYVFSKEESDGSGNYLYGQFVKP
jgi:hypothetical protein